MTKMWRWQPLCRLGNLSHHDASTGNKRCTSAKIALNNQDSKVSTSSTTIKNQQLPLCSSCYSTQWQEEMPLNTFSSNQKPKAETRGASCKLPKSQSTLDICMERHVHVTPMCTWQRSKGTGNYSDKSDFSKSERYEPGAGMLLNRPLVLGCLFAACSSAHQSVRH